MKLSTKGRYAVSAMFCLAAYGEDKAMHAVDIATKEGIPLPYLEQLLLKLKKARLVKSLRGPGGGYLLARRPAKISIGDVIRAADGPVALAECVPRAGACPRSGCCSTRSLWGELSTKISNLLDSTSLVDLCKELKS